MPDNTPTTTAALHPDSDSVDMPKIMALLKKQVPVSPIKETTRALRRERARLATPK